MTPATLALAIGLALVAALASAAQALFVRLGTQHGRAADAVLVGMAVNLVVLVPIVGLVYYPEYGLSTVSWLSFAAAGLFGTLLGRLFSYSSISRIGASRTSPIMASNALFATGLSVLFLGEQVTALHAVGVVAIVAGVAVISWETAQGAPPERSRRHTALALMLPFGAALAYGLEPVFASAGLQTGTPPAVGLTVKTAVATAGFVLYRRLQGALPRPSRANWTDLRWFVAAGLANTVFLLGYYLALAIAPVSVVVPVVITNTVFVVVLSALFLPQRLERVTVRLVAATVVVVAGVLVVTLAA